MKHFKIRLRECKGIQTLLSLLSIVFIMDLINIFKAAVTYADAPNLISSPVYSDFGLGLMLIACVYYTFQYGEYNEKHQIFPQNSCTRFLSFELYCYLTHILTQSFALGLYLLEYLVCCILNQIYGNVRFAYTMDASFMLAGFFVNLLYGFLLISFFILISSLVRKFKWWAFAAYAIVFLALWMTKDFDIFIGILNFYLKEDSLLLFFAKAILTWLLLEVMNQILAFYTGIISARKFVYRNIILASIIFLSLLSNIISTIINRDESYQYQFPNNDFIDTAKDKPACSIDAEKLAVGSELNMDEHYYQINGENQFSDCYNSTKDKIMIFYIPKTELRDWVNVTFFTNPQIDASLEGNTLKIWLDYDKNIKIISLYPYSTLMQFDCFRTKSFAKKYNNYLSGLRTGQIKISTPESKAFKLQYDNWPQEAPNAQLMAP